MPLNARRLTVRAACIVLFVSCIAGCASTNNNPKDPFEPLNRGVYQFNDALDQAIFKPVAQGYRAVLPSFVRTGVSNFFSNINDVLVALNNLLQGKFTAFVSDFGRIAINSTLGIGGIFDIASEAGIEKHEEDFGQTLGWWGFSDGPFLMLPILGPSTARDTIGRFVDYRMDLVTYVRPRHVRNIMWGTKFVNRRAELLDAGTILETAALDPYEFIRDAYLQRRRNLVYDGAPPPDSDKDLNAPEPSKPRSEDIRERTASSASEAAPSAGELEAALESLPPVRPARRTARAAAAAALVASDL